VYTASRDRSILCWDLVTGARCGALTQRMGGLNAIALHPDNLQLISVGQEKKITFW
jgi:WD40 repeat protein